MPDRVTVGDACTEPLAGDGMSGAAGACVSTRTVTPAEDAETPPEVLVAVAVNECAPSETALSPVLHVPASEVVAEPRVAAPSSTVIVVPGSAVPDSVTIAAVLQLLLAGAETTGATGWAALT